MSVTQSNNQSSKAMWPFEGLSLASATALANVASFALIACVLGGLVSGFVLVQTTGVKERHLSGARNELRQKLSNLESELEKTKAAAADANGRAAEAQTQLEQLKASRVARDEQAPPPNARARETQASPREVQVSPREPQASPREVQAPPREAQTPPREASTPPARPAGSRALSDQQIQLLIQRMSSFKGHHVTVGASPATAESGGFADQLVLALKSAGVSANRNDASAGIQVGSARGVVARYVTGNDRGAQFAKSLAEQLSSDGIAAKATGGLVEEIMKELVKLGRGINDPANEWVVIAVGNKA